MSKKRLANLEQQFRGDLPPSVRLYLVPLVKLTNAVCELEERYYPAEVPERLREKYERDCQRLLAMSMRFPVRDVLDLHHNGIIYTPNGVRVLIKQMLEKY